MNRAKKLLMKYKPRRYKNLVKNGDFLNGVIGWSNPYASLSSVDGVCELTIDRIDNQAVRIETLNDDAISGNSYYLYGDIFPSHNKPTYLRYGNGNTGAVSVTPFVWNSISGVVTAQDNARLRFYHQNDNYSYGIGDTFKMKNIIAVNLTALGLEDKSKEWCDKHIAPNIDYWNFVNEIRNGDFREGVEGHKVTGVGLLSVNNGVATLETEEPLISYNNLYANSNGFTTHKYYCSFEINPFRTHAPKVYITGGYGFSSDIANMGEFSQHSVIIEGAWVGNECYFYDNGSANEGRAKGVKTHYRNLKIVDLTKLGLENQTKEWCDQHIAPRVNMRRYDNLIENGDFSDGTSGWVGEMSDITATSNVLTVTGNGLHVAPRLKGTQFYNYKGHKYYVSFRGKITNEDCLGIVLQMRGVADYEYIKTIQSPTINEEYHISGILVNDNGDGYNYLYPYHSYGDVDTAIGKTMEVRNCIFTDLTAKYGLGNEPSKEWCDKNIAPYINY